MGFNNPLTLPADLARERANYAINDGALAAATDPRIGVRDYLDGVVPDVGPIVAPTGGPSDAEGAWTEYRSAAAAPATDYVCVGFLIGHSYNVGVRLATGGAGAELQRAYGYAYASQVGTAGPKLLRFAKPVRLPGATRTAVKVSSSFGAAIAVSVRMLWFPLS
jgi:hypothetical protein